MSENIKNLKICLVTDWLTNLSGAEKVVKTIADIFPNAPIYTTVANFEAVKYVLSRINNISREIFPKNYSLGVENISEHVTKESLDSIDESKDLWRYCLEFGKLNTGYTLEALELMSSKSLKAEDAFEIVHEKYLKHQKRVKMIKLFFKIVFAPAWVVILAIGWFFAQLARLKELYQLYNFFSNATKFTPEGGKISINASMLDDKTIRIAVSDTGCGIPEDQIDHVFEKFRQLDGSITRKGAGTGLGLAISTELAHLLSAKVSVESELGVGSTFYLDLPIMNLQQVKDLDQEQEEEGNN